MSAPTLKPGTRCECDDYDCARMSVANAQHRSTNILDGEPYEDRCTRDAVCMVTTGQAFGAQRQNKGGIVPIIVPMCEPCAVFHHASTCCTKAR